MAPRTALCFASLAVLLCLHLGRSHAQTHAQNIARNATFSTSSKMVLVPVTVTDHYGKTITGLQAKDFVVSDDQTPQQIVSFGTQDTPCSAGLVLDVSGSVRSTLDMVKAQRALVTVSDEMDNHSQYSKGELLRVALEADVQVYAIIIDNGAGSSSTSGLPFRPSMITKPGQQAAQRQGPDLLEELAEKTGGLYFHAR